MATERQIAANRANAQKSTGPRTIQGKATSSMNAQTHGCYSTRYAIPRGANAEDPDEIKAFIMAIVTDLAPRDTLEHAAAENVALTLVRVRRLGVLEAEAIADATRPTLAMETDTVAERDDVFRERGAVAAITEVLEKTVRIDRHLANRLKAALDTYMTLAARELQPTAMPSPEVSP